MWRLEVSAAARHIYMLLGFKRLISTYHEFLFCVVDNKIKAQNVTSATVMLRHPVPQGTAAHMFLKPLHFRSKLY